MISIVVQTSESSPGGQGGQSIADADEGDAQARQPYPPAGITTSNQGLGAHSAPTARIGLLWHSVTSGNLGVGALTASHISIVENIARELGVTVHFTILSWHGDLAPYINQNNVDVFAMRTRDLLWPGGLFSRARQCDMVLDISAGDSFSDIYGGRRFFLNSLSKIAVLLAWRPLLMSPQTIGPFHRTWARLLAGFLMRRARVVTTRDNLTTEFIQPFNLGSRVVEATDVAFRLPYAASEERSDGIIRVGLNVSGLLFNGGYSGTNMFDLAADYQDLVRSLIGHFTTCDNCELHLIGHVKSERLVVEDDFRVSEQLAEEFGSITVAPPFKDPSQAKSYIATMDFFCGSRMHACIAAFSSGVPVVPIAYSRKFAGLFGTLGYDWVADCRTQSADEITDLVVQAFDRRVELKIHVDECAGRAQAKLTEYENVLRTVLAAARGTERKG